MAISFIRTTPLSHPAGGGRGASAHLAYRACAEIKCCRIDRTFDFTAKKSLIGEKLLGSIGTLDLQGFAHEMERAELKKDGTEKTKARYGREFVIAMPAELSEEKNWKLALEYGQKLVDDFGIGCHVALHRPDPLRVNEHRDDDSLKNVHAHITITERAMTAGVLHGNKIRDLNKKESLADLKTWGEDRINNSLALLGHDPIPKPSPLHIPQKHMGHAVSALVRKGFETHIGSYNEQVRNLNGRVFATGSPNIKLHTHMVEKGLPSLLSAPTNPQKEKKGYYVIESYRSAWAEVARTDQAIEATERTIGGKEQKIIDYNLQFARRKRESENIQRRADAGFVDIEREIQRFEREIEHADRGILSAVGKYIDDLRRRCSDWWKRLRNSVDYGVELGLQDRAVDRDQRQTDHNSGIGRNPDTRRIESVEKDDRGSKKESIESDEEIIIEEEDVVDVEDELPFSIEDIEDADVQDIGNLYVYTDPNTNEDIPLMDVVLNHRAMIQDEEFMRADKYLDAVFHQYDPYLESTGSLDDAVATHPNDPILARLKELSEEMDVAMDVSSLNDLNDIASVKGLSSEDLDIDQDEGIKF